ncbi:MAG: trypsin-like peptidase domain-containing protein [Verrucomicrobia bacterium]|nr:trypsin-like peptidase domain-containing protein [Verrucomicrobiota bacterium]
MKRKLPLPASASVRTDGTWFRRIWLGTAFAGLLTGQTGAVETDLRRDATVDAVEQVMPSVVNIATTRRVQLNNPQDEALRRYLEAMRRLSRRDNAPLAEEPNKGFVGSGVIIDEEGYILTNNHVVENADRIQVQLWDGREYEAQRLLRTDQKDLALLRIIRQPDEKPFKPIRLAKDDDLLLGETVITVGNPFGLGGSVSRGILSSKNRRARPVNQKLDFPDWLQTDADINPGNSGGPLINLRGELIGLNVAILGQDEGMGLGFAIPVKQISTALSDFFTLEWTASLWFGAGLKAAPYPLTVREVQTDSPADRAGLRIGQEIVEVNGKPVRSLVEFNKLVAASPDLRANLTVLENGTRRTLRADLKPMVELLNLLLQRRLGVSVQTLPLATSEPFQIKSGEGLLVSEVAPNSPAERAQIQPGFLLTDIDGYPVNGFVKAASILGNKKPGERVQLSLIVLRRVNGNLLQPQPATAVVVVR